MSYIKKRPAGYYGIAVYRDQDGKRHQKGAGTFKLKRDAKAAADELEKELSSRNIELAELSFADYYRRWYDLYKSQSLETITKSRYLSFEKFIRQYFKDRKLVDLRGSDYQAFINWFGRNHAKSSVDKINGACRSCVGYAIDDDIITKDFTHNVQLVYNRKRTRQVTYLNIDELQRLKDATADGRNPHYSSRYMILTAILTGMRKSEIQALTWKDIDHLHNTITVSKSWDELKKTFKSTKTNASNRVIPVNPELLKWLDELKVNGSTMVFQNQFRVIPTSTALNKCLRSIMDQAGIRKQGFHFHSLRHVHVAYLLSQDVDVYAISKRLGHSDITITLRTYSYLIDEFKAKNDELIISKLAALL